ncbi:MAG TPA: isopenicillin N synthase family oxygenase [Deltaproteobacteria bacterium]|nr:isopenicillin N synthase family oxygenase [Deltaproteobacteria bacterium]
MEGIPVLDFARWRSQGPDRDALVEELGASLSELGFVALIHHGIELELLDHAYAVAAQTFALSQATKQRYETPDDGRQRGYTSFGIEHAKDASSADLKEFWHVGREPGRGGQLSPNRFPSEIPEFEPTFSALFGALDALSREVLAAIALWLGLPRGWFEPWVSGGNSVLRVIHYPPIDPGLRQIEPLVRASAHEDINLLTLLPSSTAPGLELERRSGAHGRTWLPIDPPPQAMICDTGDMMQRITAGRLPATTHRVVVPPGERDRSRFSMPFFVHPHPSVRLDAIDGSAEGPTAGELLQQRLEAIGVAPRRPAGRGR